MRTVLALLPSGRRLAALVGSRAGFRIVGSLLPLVLLASWSHAEFAAYALAMGTTAFVTPLVSCGIEKSALLMLPRAADARPVLGAHMLLVAGVAAAIFAVGAGLLGVSGAWLSVLALAQAVLVGVAQTQASVLRSLGRPGPEAVAIAALGVGLLVGLVGVWALGWSPPTMLAVWICWLAAVVTTLGLRLRAEAPSRPGRVTLRDVVGRSVRMGVGDVAGAAGLAVIYAALSAAGQVDGLARLYAVMAVVSIGLNALVYLTRLAQPELSRRRMSGTWRRDGLPVGRFVLPAGVLAVAVVVVESARYAADPQLPGLVHLALVVVAVLPLLVSVVLAHFAFENGDRRTLELTTRFAVAAFAVTAVTAVVLAGPLGAIGGVAALAAGELVHGLLLVVAARSLRAPVVAATGVVIP